MDEAAGPNTDKPHGIRQTFIILVGAPAGGKSSIARAFQSLFESRVSRPLYWLATDAIRKSIACEDYGEPLKQAVYDGMFAISKKLYAERYDLLLDANFVDPTRRETFLNLSAPNDKPFTVLVTCDLKTREFRNQSRPSSQRVADDYLRQAHQDAQAFADSADLVLDTNNVSPIENATLLFRQLDRRIV